LVFSKVIDQQPVEDAEDTDAPIAVHGPPIPTAGANVPGPESIGEDGSGAAIIEG
jgi:hypothetical protein